MYSAISYWDYLHTSTVWHRDVSIVQYISVIQYIIIGVSYDFDIIDRTIQFLLVVKM